MSEFKKCKQCQSTNPESGWVTKSKSLCVECAKANTSTTQIFADSQELKIIRRAHSKLAFAALLALASSGGKW